MRPETGKRAFDIVIAAGGLVALSPVLGLAAAAVGLTSRGGVLFTQERVGRGGRRFRIIKLRTMVAGAQRLGPNVSDTEDPRITAVGAVLRRCFLDEAPQLVNVLRGDMSLVGPRPETPEYVELLAPDERRVLTVRPGMTGPSTLTFSAIEPTLLAGRPDPDGYYRTTLLHERVAADLAYLDRAGVREDVRILLATARLVLRGALGAQPTVIEASSA